MAQKKRPLLALGFGLVLAVVVVEIASRLVVAYHLPPDQVRDLVLPYETLPYRPHPYIGWELTPSRISRDGEMANRQGFRGPERPVPKKPGTYRVACLGGSTTFTQKVKEEETYPVRLEEVLKRAWPELEIEVLNAGVKGYTTAESLMNLTHKVLDHQPDAIVVYHAINDLYPRSFPGFRLDYSHCREPWVPESTAKSDALRWSERTSTFPLLRTLLTDYRKRGALYYWVYSADELRAGVDPRTNSTTMAFRRNLTAICRIARARGITCILASQAQNPETIDPNDRSPLIAEMNAVTAEVAAAEKAVFVDAAKGFPGGDTFDPGDAVHMTAKGALLLAERVGAAMVREGLHHRRPPEPSIGIETRRTFEVVPSLEPALPVAERAELSSARYLQPVSYRLYRPTPGAPASASGGLGPHDARGFRGTSPSGLELSQRRVVLFVGGSSTYGLGTAAESAFPARVGERLRERGMKAALALNGGVPGYTTAESCGALHFQYLETNPEIVVIAHDYEDAVPRVQIGFRTDYSHARKPFRWDSGRELAAFERWLATPPEKGFDPLASGVPSTALLPPRLPPATDARNARPGPYATYRNLRTLVDLARRHPSVLRVLIVIPNAPTDEPALAAIAQDYASTARLVAAETQATVVTVEGDWTAADRLSKSFLPNSTGHARLADAIADALLPAR